MRTSNTTQLYNFREVLELYPNDDTADVLTTQMGVIIRYYKEGDDYHRRHFEPLNKEEYDEGLLFLKEFRDMSEDMTHEQDDSLIIQDEFLKLNLNPFVDFMRNHKAVDSLFKLRMIKQRKTMYLHDQNIYDYKTVMETMERVELYFVNYLIQG